MTARFIVGDVFAALESLEPGSVDLVLTSPPFLALRSYLPADHPDKRDYVELYSTRELAQAQADFDNAFQRQCFERNEERRITNIEHENAKQVALEKAGFGPARLRKTERDTFNPPYIVDEAEVQE